MRDELRLAPIIDDEDARHLRLGSVMLERGALLREYPFAHTVTGRPFLAFEEAPTRRVMAIVLRRLNGDYSLMARARLDDNSQHDTGFKPIGPGTHFVEVHWRRASGQTRQPVQA